MVARRHARISGSKLALAHRWAGAMQSSLGGHFLAYQPIESNPGSFELFIRIGGDLWNELSKEQLVAVDPIATAADFPPQAEGDETVLMMGPIALQDSWQCFIGSLPQLGVRFVTILPGTLASNERHIRALAQVHWNSVVAMEDVRNLQLQNRAMVQQVTQDFEELTWLRGVSQQIGGSQIRSPMQEVAATQLPMLRSVIKAEYVALVPQELFEGEGDLSARDRDLISGGMESAGQAPCDCKQLVEFIESCVERSALPIMVFNVQTVAKLFDRFPQIRNCIVARLEKHERKFGYLVAINRELEFLGGSPEDFINFDPNGIQFGTFEAGMLMTLAAVLSSHATNGELFQEQEDLLTGVVRAVINAIDAKDPYTCGHSDRVASFAQAIAKRMGLDREECERIYLSGLLHDVGKIGVPDSILGKPTRLTDDEYAIVKKHPEVGYQILKDLQPLQDVLPGVLHHHEAFDGSGYPMGLVGDQIPLQGRILAVADAYDAMTSNRPYRDGMPTAKAEAILLKESGICWDTKAVAAMLECIRNGEVVPQSAGVPGLPAIAAQQFTYASF